jgi:hypothetical protein
MLKQKSNEKCKKKCFVKTYNNPWEGHNQVATWL